MSTRNRGRPLPDTEFRYWPTDVETSSDGEKRCIGGMFAPYSQRSRLLPGGFYELISPTALRKSLSDNLDIVCRLEHDARYLLATTESGTLEITDDPKVGASYRALLPDTSAGRDAWELVRTKRLDHSSMGFMVIPGGDEFRHVGGALERRLINVRLSEASPVSQPGYFQTTTAVRNLANQVGEDPADVAALAAKGELRTLFTRTDLSVTAPPTVEPALAEARSVTPSDIQRRLDENRYRQVEANREGRIDLVRRMAALQRRAQTEDLERRVIALNRRMFEPVGAEVRSVAVDYPRDRYGHAVDWHPGQR
jgi:uncharacterized protein